MCARAGGRQRQLRQAPDRRAGQPQRHRGVGRTRDEKLGQQLAQQRGGALHLGGLRIERQHARRREQGLQGPRGMRRVTLDQRARVEGQHIALGVGGEAKRVDHPGRDRDGRGGLAAAV